MPAPGPSAVTNRPATPASSRLRQGIAAFQAGQDKEAQRLLAKVLAKAPATVDALLVMGLLAARNGRMAEAEAWLRRCVAAAPDHALAHDNLGNALMAQGRPAEAEPCHRAATRQAPAYAPAWYNLGTALLALDRDKEGETALRQALAIDPGFIPAWIKLGNLLRESRDYSEAERVYLQILGMRPDLQEVRLNLGNVLRLQHRYRAARDQYQRLLQAVPGHPQALLSLALVALGEGEPTVAQALITQAQQEGRAGPEELRQVRVAMYAHRRDLNSLRQEIDQANEAGAAIPEYTYLLGETLVNHGLLAEAVDRWEGLLTCGAAQPSGLLGALVRCQQRLCYWRGWRERVALLVERIRTGGEAVIAPFDAFALPGLNPGDLRLVARAESRRYRSWLESGPLHARVKRPHHERLRIGYLSGDLRDHATARLAVGVFELHDRKEFEIFGYALAPTDPTPFGQRVVAAFDHFIALHELTPTAAALRIAADGIDILVDLHGYTRLGRPAILAQRPAPLQVAWLGFPGGMGAPFIDYLIADRRVIPPEETSYYDEAIAYLPHCYQPQDHQRRSAPPPTREEAGLPEHAFVFCCHNNSYKYVPEVFDVWCRLLDQVPGSILWLLAPDDQIRVNLRQEAQRRGHDPARLVFADMVPQEEHLARLGLANLFLDTWPYNAHTTASDALWAGLPVLTWPGSTFASRVAASLLSAVDLPELIATDPEDYLRRARQLAGDPATLADLRDRLARSRGQCPLFDTPGFTLALEELFRRIWARLQAGRGPAMSIPEAVTWTGA